MPSAERVTWAKFRVGATALVALAILSVLLVLLTGGRLFQKQDRLRTYLPDAAGMNPGTPVRLNGIPVGKIESVRFSGEKDLARVVEAVFMVEHRFMAQIPADSKATVTAGNVQGELFLDITRGLSRRTVASGGEIAFLPAPDVLKSIDLSQFERRLRTIDSLLTQIEQGQGRVGEFVKSDRLYRDTVARIADLEATVHRATSRQRTLGNLLYSDTAYQRAVAPLRRIDESLARLQKGEWLRDTGRYERLRAQMADIRKSLDRTRQSPFFASDAMYDGWTRGVAALARSVDEFNMRPAVQSAQPYEALNGAMRELAASMRDFRTDPRKYLRLSIF